LFDDKLNGALLGEILGNEDGLCVLLEDNIGRDSILAVESVGELGSGEERLVQNQEVSKLVSRSDLQSNNRSG